jgi:hypothetical protein
LRELDRVKGDYEGALRDVKELHEQEKMTLEDRLDR